MMKLLNTGIWFLKKPKYLPQIFQILRRSKNKELENTREESTLWCQDNAVSKEEALKSLGIEGNFKLLENLFPEIISEARKTALECPVKMGGEGGINVLYHIIKSKGSKSVIETGVAYGWSSLAILLAIKDHEDAFLVSNDMPYIKMNNDDYVGCVVPQKLRSKWKLQRAADINGIPKAINHFKGKIDLFHYDSDKSYTGRMWSMPIIWKSINKGGMFISDDINDNIAFKVFSEELSQKPIIFEHLGKFVGILVK